MEKQGTPRLILFILLVRIPNEVYSPLFYLCATVSNKPIQGMSPSRYHLLSFEASTSSSLIRFRVASI